MVNRTYIVEMDEYKSTDFRDLESIATRNLEACTAVVTYTPFKGTLSHLTNISNLNNFFRWLQENVQPGTNAYITGGMDEKSEWLVGELEKGVLTARLNLVGKNVLGPYRRHIELTNIGTLYIEKFRQWMNAAREIEDMPMGMDKVCLD